MKLNKNDYLLLECCKEAPLSISNISKKINISVTNVSARLEKLRTAGFIVVKEGGRGKATHVKSNKNNVSIKNSLMPLKYLIEMDKKNETPSDIKSLRKECANKYYDIDEIILFLLEKGLIGFRITPTGLKFIEEQLK